MAKAFLDFYDLAIYWVTESILIIEVALIFRPLDFFLFLIDLGIALVATLAKSLILIWDFLKRHSKIKVKRLTKISSNLNYAENTFSGAIFHHVHTLSK